MVCSGSTQTPLHQRYLLQQAIHCNAGYQSYLAVDLQTHRRCVIRSLLLVLDNASEALRQMRLQIQREVLVFYQIRHPKLSQLLAVFEEQQHLFFVQEFIPGQTLQDWLHLRQQWGEQFSEADIIHVLQQVLPVLAHIHERGVVHGNLSLDSIIGRSPHDLALNVIEKSVVKIAWDAVDLSLVFDFTRIKALASQLTEASDATERKTLPVYKSLDEAIAQDIRALAGVCLTLLTGKEVVLPTNEHPGNDIDTVLASVGDRLGSVLRSMILANTSRSTVSDILNQLQTVTVNPAGAVSSVQSPAVANVQLPFYGQPTMQGASTIQSQSASDEHHKQPQSKFASVPSTPLAQVKSFIQHTTIKRKATRRATHDIHRRSASQATRPPSRSDQRHTRTVAQLSWMQIGLGVLVVGLIGIPSLYRSLEGGFGDNEVWISGTRVSRSEADQILALTMAKSDGAEDAQGELSTGGGVASMEARYAANDLLHEFTQAQPIDFSPQASAIALVEQLQDDSPRLYSLEVDRPTQITLDLEGIDATATVLQVTATRIEAIARNTQTWSGAMTPGNQYILQVSGSGSFVMNITKSLPTY
jgi:serine/threonine-protein kinase